MELRRVVKKEGKGWYCRGYLPHLDMPTVQFITFRLADSLPLRLLQEWKRELRSLPRSERKLEEYKRVEAHIDRGAGKCVLALSEVASIVETALVAGHSEAYQLLAWSIMPNHVHFVARFFDNTELDACMHGLKGATAREINARLGRRGALCAREYHDRFMRSDRQFEHSVGYVHANPVKAGLCRLPNEFRFGSARILQSADWDDPDPFRALHLEAKPLWEEMRNARKRLSGFLSGGELQGSPDKSGGP